MSNFDEKLKQALDNGTPIDFDRGETLTDMTIQVFRSKIRWAVILLWVEGFIFSLVALWAGIRMYYAQEFKHLIVYATVLIVCTVTTALLKTMYMQFVNKYSIMREIKRLELRIAEINEKKSD